jgi:hypothetical protein
MPFALPIACFIMLNFIEFLQRTLFELNKSGKTSLTKNFRLMNGSELIFQLKRTLTSFSGKIAQTFINGAR